MIQTKVETVAVLASPDKEGQNGHGISYKILHTLF